jgi:putative nucleotidyltransferase with HDIG domain
MKISVDRASVRCAEEVFRTISIAINCIQTYTESHPRYIAAVERIQALVQDYFQRNSDSQHMTFFADGKRVEFRKIPLTNVGSNGERLIKLFHSRGIGGLQLQAGASAQDLRNMVKALAGSTGDAKAASEEPASGKASTAQLISKAAAEEMQMDWQSSLSAEVEVDDGIGVPEFQVLEDTAHSLLSTYRNFLSRPEEGVLLNHDVLKDTVDQALSVVSANQMQSSAATIAGYFDDFTFHHSVNVCLITTSVAGTIIKDKEKLRKVSLAALLHDVGKSRIPEEILHKPGRLSASEFDVMKKHPVIGAEMLLAIDKIEPLCVTVAFGHHLLNDQSRYPITRKAFAPEWITKLISVVDIYEALTAVRPYKKGLSPRKAFEIMFGMQGLERSFDIVKFVYDRLGPYPVGAVVELTTKERGVVTCANSANPQCPKVRLFTDCERRMLPYPLDLDLSDPQIVPAGRPMPRIARTIVRQSQSDNLWADEVDPEPGEILGAPLTDDQTLMAREC